MDPASLTLGVVALAANMVQASQGARDAISTYKSASDDLDQFFKEASIIEEGCKEIRTRTATLANQSLVEALNLCEDNIADLYNEIGRVKSRKEGVGRSWSYLNRQSCISKSLRNLQKSLGIVHFCLHIETFSSSTVTRQAPPSEPSGVIVQPFVSEPPAYTRDDFAPPPPPPYEQDSSFQEIASIKPLGTNVITKHNHALYPLSVLPTSTWDKGDVESNRSKIVKTHLMGALFQRGLRASSNNPLNMILDSTHLIHEDHNKFLYDAVRAGPKGTTMPEAAEWFCKLNISPRAQIVSTRGQKMSVLGAMFAFRRPTAFNYLCQIAERELADQQFIELAESYLRLRGDSLTVQELVFIVHLDRSPKFFSSIVEMGCELLEPQTEEWDMFMFFNECYLIHIICGNSSEDFDPVAWAPCAAKLRLSYPKLTIHEINMVLPSWRDPRTGEPAQGPTATPHEDDASQPKFSSLQLFLTSDRTYPIEALEQAERWLLMLTYAGRDVNRYLDQELAGAQELPFSNASFRKPDTWDELNYRGKLQTIFDCLRPGKRLAAEDGTTDDLLEIMPAFRYWHKQKPKPKPGVWVYDWTRRNWVKTEDKENRIAQREWSNNCGSTDWKDLKSNSDFALNSWPMCWDITTSPMITNRAKHMGEGYARYRQVVDFRFERRQARKQRKQGKQKRGGGSQVTRGKAVVKLGPMSKTWWESLIGV